MINAITGATSRPPEASIANSIGADQDMFLQLLVAQVRYQDPLEPMDNNEYMAQTAQFTMVEQITKLAEQQSELLAFQRAVLAAEMVGKNVTGFDELAGRSIAGVVDAVEYNYGDPQLVIGAQRIGLDEVISTGAAPDDGIVADETAGPEATETAVAADTAAAPDTEPVTSTTEEATV